jgi:hypothetical protein
VLIEARKFVVKTLDINYCSIRQPLGRRLSGGAALDVLLICSMGNIFHFSKLKRIGKEYGRKKEKRYRYGRDEGKR